MSLSGKATGRARSLLGRGSPGPGTSPHAPGGGGDSSPIHLPAGAWGGASASVWKPEVRGQSAPASAGLGARGWPAHVHTNTATRRSFPAPRLRRPGVATVSSAPCPPPTYSPPGQPPGGEDQPLRPFRPREPETNLHPPLTSSRGSRAASPGRAPSSPPTLFSP